MNRKQRDCELKPEKKWTGPQRDCGLNLKRDYGIKHTHKKKKRKNIANGTTDKETVDGITKKRGGLNHKKETVDGITKRRLWTEPQKRHHGRNHKEAVH